MYTVPPWLQALTGGLGHIYSGGKIFTLPSAHMYEGRPRPGEWPTTCRSGIDMLLAIVERRFPQHDELLRDEPLQRLAQSSGGDLRNFLRMVRMVVTAIPRTGLPLPEAIVEHAEGAVRGDLLPIAEDDLEWLASIARHHGAALPTHDARLDLARLQASGYVSQHHDDNDWYAVHPLLRQELTGFTQRERLRDEITHRLT